MAMHLEPKVSEDAAQNIMTPLSGSPAPRRRRLSGSPAPTIFEEAPELLHFPAGLQTPRAGPPPPAPGFVLCTPEATKRSLTTPVSFSDPLAAQRRVEEDIAVGLQLGSASLVSVALLQGHCCSTVLYEAVRRRRVDVLDLLLDSGEHDMDEASDGHRPLHLAIEMSTTHGDVGYRMAERLLLRGARPGTCTSDSQPGRGTPLHSAVAQSNVAAAQLLLAHGADPRAVDGAGRAPLHVLAAQMPSWMDGSDVHREVSSLLLEHGACPAQRDAFGRTPLQAALDPALWEILAEVEQRWSKAALASALASARGDARRTNAACMAILPEIFWNIGEFF